MGFSKCWAQQPALPYWDILLPFGISFYTFETISYTIDVYRRHLKAEREFIHYGLFVAFFPKLVAGPIQRAAELIDQLKERPAFDIGFLTQGHQPHPPRTLPESRFGRQLGPCGR